MDHAKLIFEDNFTGADLDPAKWVRCPEYVRCNGFCIWNNDLSYLDGKGHLVLRMEWDAENKRVRSGAVFTKGLFDGGYGYYEARIKFPVAYGTWGAFWMMLGDLNRPTAAEGLEIDIVESIGNESHRYQSVLHWNYPDLHSLHFLKDGDINIYDGEFHTFSVLRAESGYTFYVDGQISGYATPENCLPCPLEGYMILSCEAAEWAGAGTPECIADLPAEMVVDYVRVYDSMPNLTAQSNPYYGEWTSPSYPGAVNNRIPNTALLGNGDVGISSDGSDTVKSYNISKGDFWEYNNRPLRAGTISIGALTKHDEADAQPTEAVDFNEKEDILHAEIVTRQNLADVPMQVKSWMSATNNLFVMEITSLSKMTAADVRITLEGYVNGNRPTTAEVGDSYMVVTRSTVGAKASDPKSYTSKIAMATRVIGADGRYEVGDDSTAYLSLNLPAGETVYVITAICGGGRTYDGNGNLWAGRTEPVDEAVALLNTVVGKDDVESLHTAHLDWWKDYWRQSYISLDTSDEDLAVLQKYYYAAQYELGSGIREGNIAAGLYGIWHTNDDASWHSDYHLNYNFISAYYGLATSNRVSMITPAVEALMDYIPQGIENAGSYSQLCAVYAPFVQELIEKGRVDRQNGISDAILFPVAIGPYGMTLEKDSYHHETVNAPFSAYPLIEYYNFTQDEAFMKDTLYVYLKYVLTFLEHWIVEEDGRYTLYAGYNEGSWAINPALELAAYKMCLKYGIDISEKLGVDADRRATWQKIYGGMADQPTAENFNGTGKTVLALAEMEWIDNRWVAMSTPVPGDGNCIPLESIIPGEVYGYYSSDEKLEILQNTIDVFSERGAWTQINNFPKLPPVAVNARYDCRKIVTGFSNAVRSHMQANLMIDDGVHGIEKAGATEAINNMLLLSDRGVIKLFGNWLEDKDAKFVRLRASGAFVFSAEYNGNAREILEGVTMYSEAGATATVASLWPEGMVVLDENGSRVETTKGTAPNHEEEITDTFATEAGKTYTFIKTSSYVEPVTVTMDVSASAENKTEPGIPAEHCQD